MRYPHSERGLVAETLHGVKITWTEFERQQPALADAGRRQLYQVGIGLAFLATVRPDGGPRVHPVCPVLSDAGPQRRKHAQRRGAKTAPLELPIGSSRPAVGPGFAGTEGSATR